MRIIDFIRAGVYLKYTPARIPSIIPRGHRLYHLTIRAATAAGCLLADQLHARAYKASQKAQAFSSALFTFPDSRPPDLISLFTGFVVGQLSAV